MITLTVIYRINDEDGTVDMWVEDAPHILVKSAASVLDASSTLNCLITEEVRVMWGIKGEWTIQQYKMANV